MSERQLVDQDSSLRSDSGPDVLDQLSQDEEEEGAAQLAKLPLMSVLVLQVALSFHSD